jgi:hypothetical protein
MRQTVWLEFRLHALFWPRLCQSRNPMKTRLTQAPLQIQAQAPLVQFTGLARDYTE